MHGSWRESSAAPWSDRGCSVIGSIASRAVGLPADSYAAPVERWVDEKPDALAVIGDDDRPPIVLAATDPAQPFGAAVPWPESTGRPSRAAGALVVLAGADALAYLERGSHKVLRFPAATTDDRWAAALAALVDIGRFRSLELRAIDGVDVHATPEVHDSLRGAGFQPAYKGWIKRGRGTGQSSV